MLSPWPQHRRGSRYGSAPKPPSVVRLILLLIVVIGAILWLLRSAYPS